MAEITFLRHAETELNKMNLFCGTTDCSITKNGAISAKNLREEFPDEFDVYYCSPLKRTWQTLQAIYPNSKFIIDPRITEINLGIWEGISKTSVNQDLRKQFKSGTFSPKGSESHESVKSRAIDFLNDMSKKYTHDEKILIITHNGFLRTLTNLLDIKPISKNLEYFTLDLSSIK